MRSSSVVLVVALSLALSGNAGAGSGACFNCKPSYVVLDRPVKVLIGASELTFRLLAIGCKEELNDVWPPDLEILEKQLAIELREPHPVKTLFLIYQQSPQLRQRVARRLNLVLGKDVVSDVFLYSAKAAE